MNCDAVLRSARFGDLESAAAFPFKRAFNEREMMLLVSNRRVRMASFICIKGFLPSVDASVRLEDGPLCTSAPSLR